MWWNKVTYRNYFLAAAALSILSALVFFVAKSFLPPLIPLFYGKPTGSEQLASTWLILIVPAVSIIITIINVFINTRTEDDFIKKVLAIASFIVSLMAAVTVFKIISLVGFF